MAIGRITKMDWTQRSEGICLSIYGIGAVSVWKLTETYGTYQFKLQWTAGSKKLYLKSADMTDVVGLSAVDLKLMEQHGATTTNRRMEVEEYYHEWCQSESDGSEEEEE